MWNAFAKLSTEQLMQLQARQVQTCVDVVSLSRSERDKNGPKGAASPNQAGFVTAVFATMFSEEIARRNGEAKD